MSCGPGTSNIIEGNTKGCVSGVTSTTSKGGGELKQTVRQRTDSHGDSQEISVEVDVGCCSMEDNARSVQVCVNARSASALPVVPAHHSLHHTLLKMRGRLVSAGFRTLGPQAKGAVQL